MTSHPSLAQWRDDKGKERVHFFNRLILLLGIGILTYGLCGYAITGSYARYVQDDYCYAAILGRQDFWEGQLRSFLEETTYNGNRFSLTLIMGISESLGRPSVGALPGLVVILWVVSFVLTLRNASLLAGFSLSWIEIIFAAESVVFLTLSQAPNLAQVLYWRPGMLPYLAPLVTQTFLIAAILGEVRRHRSSPLVLAGIALLALISAGFSETAAAFQTGLCTLLFFAAWLGLRIKRSISLPAFHATWSALLGTLIGMLLLIISPAGKRMQVMHYGPPQNLLSLLEISLDSVTYFIKYTLYRVTVPTLFTFVFFLFLGFLVLSMKDIPQHPYRHSLVFFIASAAIVLMLLICITAPSAYVQGEYPELRALIGARMVLVIWLAFLGIFSGMLARLLLSRHRQEIYYLGAAGALLASLIMVLFFVQPGSLQDPAYPDIRSFARQSPLFFFLVPLLGLAFGIILGFLLSRFSLGKAAFELSLLVIFIFLLLPHFRTSISIYSEMHYYQKRASLWDLRDAEIRQAEEDGMRNIQVRAIDSLAGVSELQENPGNWINRCAAWLYGMESISAVPK